MNNEKDKYYLNIKNTLLCLIGFLFFFYYLLSITKKYPYYFSWDMNLAVIVDNILLKSEKYSNLLAHPGFGMNLLLLLTTKIIHNMGFISIENLNDLALSLDPISCVVELTQIIELHSPFLITMILFSIWISLCVVMKTNTIQSILIFFVFALSESNIIHSSFIRVGTYSILFLALSIFFLIFFTRSNNMLSKHIYLFISGVLIGLSFLTKVQMLFLLTLPLLLLFFSEFYNGKKRSYKIRVNNLVNISLINFLAFLILSLLSFFILIPDSFSSWMSAEDYGKPTFVFFLFFSFFSFLFLSVLFLVDQRKIKSLLKLVLVFLFLCFIPILSHRSIEPIFMGYFSKKMLVVISFYTIIVFMYSLVVLFFNQIKIFLFSKSILKNTFLRLVKFFNNQAHEFLAIIIVFMSGFLFSFLFHFFVFSDFRMSFNYMLYDFKVMFFRSTFYVINLEIILDELINKTIFYYKELLINLVITITILLGYKKNYINVNFKTLLTILALFFIIHFNIYFGTRLGVEYDSLFVDYSLNIYSVLGLIAIYNRFHIHKIKIRLFCLSIFSTILFLNINQALVTEKLFKHHAHYYRWQNNRWKAGAYLGNHLSYTQLMQSMYNKETADLACKLGVYQKSRFLDAKFVLPNQKINQRQIGIVANGLPTMIDHPQYKIISYPIELKNAIIVDNLMLNIPDKGLYAPDSLIYPRYKNLSDSNKLLAICPRLDLEIYFFTDEPSDGEKVLINKDKILSLKKYFKESEDLINDFINRKLKPQPQIVLENNQDKMIFYGYHINSFTEISIDDLTGHGFFVIKQAMVPM